MNDKTKNPNKIAKEMMKEESSNYKEEFSDPIWSKEEKELSMTLYGCEIMGEKCTEEELRNKNLPNDTYIISYFQNEKLFHDLVRGRRVKIFDMYWDKIRNNIQNIDFGYGTINPKVWGYQKPKQKTRK